MDVVELLEKEGVAFERSDHQLAFTARQLASAEHVPPRNVAKPVLVKSDGKFTLCVLPASRQLDLGAVADCLCADHVRLAFEEELVEVFSGCEVGAEPPIGVLFGLRTLVDYSLMDDDYVVFQAGSHSQSIRMRGADFDRVADPMYGNIAL